VSDSVRFIDRAKGLLSGGLGSVRVIVCSDSGVSVPVLGSGKIDSLMFDEAVDFDVCFNFLERENYSCVDLVSAPGEFCLRGGLVDVFPYTSLYPFRINFLDDMPAVYRFDVDTQLTRYRVNNFSITSVSAGERRPLCDVSLDDFLSLLAARLMVVRPRDLCLILFVLLTELRGCYRVDLVRFVSLFAPTLAFLFLFWGREK
jgi:hypothetical protein